MLKTTGSIGSAANLKKTKDKVGGSNLVDNSMIDSDETTN